MIKNTLELKNIGKKFKNSNGSFTHAVKTIDLVLEEGKCIALVGGSGCGKSTLARLISHLIPSTSGAMYFRGKDVTKMHHSDLKKYYRRVQMIFQNPLDTFSPRMKIKTYLMEPFLNFGLLSRIEARKKALELLELVGLDQSYMEKYPNEVSGGQLQRVVIARAIGLKPEILIFDEATSALDVTIQSNILKLVCSMKLQQSYSSIFITHDLALAEKMADKIYVMCEGEIVEVLESGYISEEASHPYTQALLNAVF